MRCDTKTPPLEGGQNEGSGVVDDRLESVPVLAVFGSPRTAEPTVLVPSDKLFEAKFLIPAPDVRKGRAKHDSPDPVPLLGNEQTHTPSDALAAARVMEALHRFVESNPSSSERWAPRNWHKVETPSALDECRYFTAETSFVKLGKWAHDCLLTSSKIRVVKATAAAINPVPEACMAEREGFERSSAFTP